MRVEIQHYVEWLYPGAFYPEESVERVESRDLNGLKIPDGVFAFRFYDAKVTHVESEIGEVKLPTEYINKTGRYYPDGRLMTLEEVAAEVPNSNILQGNMRINGWDPVVRARAGNFQPFNDGDVIFDMETRLVHA